MNNKIIIAFILGAVLAGTSVYIYESDKLSFEHIKKSIAPERQEKPQTICNVDDDCMLTIYPDPDVCGYQAEQGDKNVIAVSKAWIESEWQKKRTEPDFDVVRVPCNKYINSGNYGTQCINNKCQKVLIPE